MDVKKKEMDLLSNSIAAYAHIKGKRPEQPSVIGRFTAAVKEVIHRQYLSWRTVFLLFSYSNVSYSNAFTDSK